MERTIDGIDYIAKSEVLRIIEDDMREAQMMAADNRLSDTVRYGWTAHYFALSAICFRLFTPQER